MGSELSVCTITIAVLPLPPPPLHCSSWICFQNLQTEIENSNVFYFAMCLFIRPIFVNSTTG